VPLGRAGVQRAATSASVRCGGFGPRTRRAPGTGLHGRTLICLRGATRRRALRGDPDQLFTFCFLELQRDGVPGRAVRAAQRLRRARQPRELFCYGHIRRSTPRRPRRAAAARRRPCHKKERGRSACGCRTVACSRIGSMFRLGISVVLRRDERGLGKRKAAALVAMSTTPQKGLWAAMCTPRMAFASYVPPAVARREKRVKERESLSGPHSGRRVFREVEASQVPPHPPVGGRMSCDPFGLAVLIS
jgi:hypothetical protein